MNSNLFKPLKIYSASAGSGKTYNLVLMYLRLILSDSNNQKQFSSIIAMTFTNKAAIEMKNRIIAALNTLGNFDNTNEKSVSYLKDIAKELKLDQQLIISRAKVCLKEILHQYEQFNVLTIDKFNLRLIRSFAKDLNINTDFQTTTNEKDVISEIVDLLFDEINQPNFEKLTTIALKYAKENANEENKWDFKKDVKSLAETLIKEQNFSIIQTLLLQDFSIQSYEKLKLEINSIKKQIEDKAKDLHSLFFSFDTTNVPGASTTIKAFEKLLTPDLFSSKANEYFFNNTICTAFEIDAKKTFHPEIKEKGIQFIDFYFVTVKKIFELEEYKKNFFNIALLQLIAIELENYKKTDNVVLISEFNKLISNLLKNEEAPYIYERIGNRYKHYLLDEFQDTSRLQWMNLIPLIHDSLGNLNENLIVGDPKQSIYRFKNGLAEQFVALPKIYNPENDLIVEQKSLFFESMGEQKSLNQNWRSKKEIVQFNNEFFELIKENSSDLIAEFYKDVKQDFNDSNDGAYVFVESQKIEKKKNNIEFNVTENDDFNDKLNDTLNEEESDEDLNFLLTWIQDCLNDGYDKGDICLLGYTAKQCNNWATFLTNNNHKVVSSDSLLLSSDSTVQFILSYIRWRKNPSGELEAKRFAENYFNTLNLNPLECSKKYWKTKIYNEREQLYFDSNAFIIDYFDTEEIFFFHYENLYQMVQQFYRLCNINELENPYIHQFSDYIFLFDQNYGPDLTLFLENYENEGYKISVQIPENKDAIKILTAHKSKGLEFPIVFIPNLKWNLLVPQNKYLIQNKEHIYYQSISKNSKIDAISNYYEKEYQQAFLDKLNLVYVAFTRPKDRLYIMNVADRGKKDIYFENKMHEFFTLLPKILNNNEIYSLEMGFKSRKKAETTETTEFHPKFVSENLWFPDISIQNRELIAQNELSDQRRFGNQLHYLIAQIDSENEIDEVINQAVLKGKIEKKFTQDLQNEIHSLFLVKEYKTILDQATIIYREQDIVLSSNESKRPDLIIQHENKTIVLDYKTGLENSKYYEQIQSYCNTLVEMNFPNVTGFLFYTHTKKLEQIT
jgi:ATP-dependent exoDNAse (exonuclease V) beta subunit